jgi:hypothetical protein
MEILSSVADKLVPDLSENGRSENGKSENGHG